MCLTHHQNNWSCIPKAYGCTQFPEISNGISKIYKYVYVPARENIMCMTCTYNLHPWPTHIEISTHDERKSSTTKSQRRESYIRTCSIEGGKPNLHRIDTHVLLGPASMQRHDKIFFCPLLLLLSQGSCKKKSTVRSLACSEWSYGTPWLNVQSSCYVEYCFS